MAFKTRGRREIKKKSLQKRKRTQTRLERELDEHLVQSRDNIEKELARVRPVYARKRKRVADIEEEKAATPAPTKKKRRRGKQEHAEDEGGGEEEQAPPEEKKVDPLNPLGESNRFRAKRTRGRDPTSAGPAGPGVDMRAREMRRKEKEEKGLTASERLLRMIAAKRAARESA
eukprot:Hpha_TRINITY_DN6445_c0_g1::TRINITY_DN6445_c0_g1_i1::g.143::m.143